MSKVYRQTISDEMAARLAVICEERGVSLQELTLIALFQLLGNETPVSLQPALEETQAVDVALTW